MKIGLFSKSALLLFFISFLFISGLQAQSFVFQVLVNDQGGEIKRGQEWEVLQSGTELQSGDLLRLQQGAYVGLIHHSGQTLELNKTGTYEVSRLEEKIGSEAHKTAAKYASLYIRNQSAPASAALQRERSLENKKLKILLPNSVDVFNDEVIIRWKNEDSSPGSYVLKVKNMFDEVIYSAEVDDTKAIIDFDKDVLDDQRLLIVTVNSKVMKDLQSADYGMKQLSAEEAAPIARELKELKLEINDEQSALDKLILAAFYEQNNLLADALTNYEYALSLAPGNKAYQTAYEQFIFRNGLGY